MIQYTIEQLHELLNSGELNAKTYYKELLEEANLQQDRLNAFVRITEDKALEDLSSQDFKSILSGIPFVAKDNYNTKGIHTTASSMMLDDYVPIYNATAIEKINDAGACLIGKASLDELAMGGTNMSAKTGPVLNPWDTTRISGGSSGGSAALVASGLVPFALASDTGDSIRKPAGYCGVVGLKPTWGRISRFGVIPYASSLDTLGAMTRNVRDMSIVLEALAGRDNKDMTSSFNEVPHYLDNLNNDISGKKIAVLRSVSDLVKNEDIRNNFEMVVNKYKELGAVVEDVTIDYTLLKTLLAVYTVIANSEATSNHACLDGIRYGLRAEGKTTDDIMINSRTQGFSSFIKSRFILGNLALATDNQEKMFRKAQRVRRLIVEEINKILENYDIILTPNCGNIAPTLEEANNKCTDTDSLILDNHMCMANFAGCPALSLPSGFVDGMPVSVHLMGRLFDEQTVLDCAYALENSLDLKNQYKREG